MADFLAGRSMIRQQYDSLRLETTQCEVCLQKLARVRDFKIDAWVLHRVDDEDVYFRCKDCKTTRPLFGTTSAGLKLLAEICRSFGRIPARDEALALYERCYKLQLLEDTLRTQREVKQLLVTLLQK